MKLDVTCRDMHSHEEGHLQKASCQGGICLKDLLALRESSRSQLSGKAADPDQLLSSAEDLLAGS